MAERVDRVEAGAGLIGGSGLLGRSDGDLSDHAVDALGHADDALEGFAGLGGGDDALLNGAGAALHAGDGGAGAVLNAADHASDFSGGEGGGFGAIEMELTGDAQKPFDLWAVDGATIQIDPKWDGNPESTRYAQTTGLPGTNGQILLRDDQLIYIRMNPRSHTPFGLGPLEVAFETVNSFLAAHRFAGNLASNAVVQYALWMNETTPTEHERLIRWWQDEIEGTGRVPLLSTEQKPEVLRFASGTDADMRLNWQEFLIRMVANAFSVPPMLLGLEQEVNRNTASELADEAFRSAVVPLAKLLAEHLTRDLFAKKLGWREFEFVFNELDAPDEITELQIQTQLLTAGVLTVNEVRAMRGLAPIPSAPATDMSVERG